MARYPGGGGGLTRNTDPDTSHDAADRVNSAAIFALIEAFLKRTDPREYAQIEIARMIDIDKWSVTPRMVQMEEKGTVVRCAEKLALNSNNKMTWMEGWRLRRPDEPFTHPKTRKKKPCQWQQDPDGDWDTACGHRFIILAGTPTENDMRFCCYCGKPLKDTPPQPRKRRRKRSEIAEDAELPDWLR
jgi:hypothetical protein